MTSVRFCFFVIGCFGLSQGYAAMPIPTLPQRYSPFCAQNVAFEASSSEVVRRLALPFNIISGTTFFYPAGQPGCSGAWVSQHGHILTSAHCLPECLESKGYLKSAKVTVTHRDETLVQTVLKRDPKVKSVTCAMKVLGVGDVDAEVVTSGECLGPLAVEVPKTQKTKFSTDAWNEQYYKQCNPADDFVVLKIPGITAKKVEDRPVCLKTAEKDMAINDVTALVSFPSKTERPDKNSDGRQQFISAGTVIDQPYCEVQNAWEGNGKRLFLPTKPPDMVQISTDAFGASSGGPVVNAKGEIAAVLSYTIDGVSKERRDCVGSNYAVPISSVRRQVPSDLAGKIFDCPPRHP